MKQICGDCGIEIRDNDLDAGGPHGPECGHIDGPYWVRDVPIDTADAIIFYVRRLLDYHDALLKRGPDGRFGSHTDWEQCELEKAEKNLRHHFPTEQKGGNK